VYSSFAKAFRVYPVTDKYRVQLNQKEICTLRKPPVVSYKRKLDVYSQRFILFHVNGARIMKITDMSF